MNATTGRVGYFGPAGTFTHEALMAQPDVDSALVTAYPTIFDTVMAVHEGAVARALVPIENSLEGSVNATLDALAVDTEDVVIVGEALHPIRHCLIARSGTAFDAIEVVVSHPQPNAQCARFIRTRLPQASVVPAASTADAVRTVAEHDGPWAALGTALSARIHGCEVLESGVEDMAGNETRFVWLGRANDEHSVDGGSEADAWKTSVVFWGAGDDAPGWLVRCLSEFAFRGVNLTLIESRPRKLGLGHYMFFADFDGRADDAPVRAALEAVRAQTGTLRVLGSYPVAVSAM